MAALIGLPAVSYADTLQYTITSDHCSEGCGPQAGGFGTITLTDLANNQVQVSIILANNNKFINGGQDATIGFNLVGNPTITASDFSNTNFSLISSTAGSLHLDGTGFFEYGIQQNTAQGGAGAQAGNLSFIISDGAGFTAASFESTTDSLGNIFALDILSGTTGKTGFVDVSTPPVAVPEPSALLLAGTALIGVGYSLRHRIFRRRQVLAAS